MILQLVAATAISIRLLLWYGDRHKVEWYTFLFAFLGWFTGMSTVAVLPIDIVSGRYRKCVLDHGEAACTEPIVYVDLNTMYIYWEIVYWTAFCFTWYASRPLQTAN